MKNIIIFLFVVVVGGIINAQDGPIKLEAVVKKINNNQYELIISADLDPDWSLYSQNLPDGGPMPTKISFKKSSDFVLVGKPREISSYKKIVNDDVFDIKLTKFYNNVVFKQIIKLKNKNIKDIQADIDYMVCSSDTCMPPTTDTVNFRL